jgi:lysophospholipase L1-like esterase
MSSRSVSNRSRARRIRPVALRRGLIAGFFALALGGAAVVVVLIGIANNRSEALQAELDGYVPYVAPVEEPVAARPIVAFLGDSYTEGAGSDQNRLSRWTTIVSRDLGWAEVPFGVGGSGFVRGEIYGSRVDAVIESGANVVIISGGRNDTEEPIPEVRDAALAVMEKLRNGLPDAQIVVISPWWDDDAVPSALGEVADAMEFAATSVGGDFIDAGQPLQGRPDLLAPDGVHPNNEGHAAIAASVEPLLRERIFTAG